MKRLQRYIAKTVIGSTLLVVLLLCGLQMFVIFINELGDIGRGDYSTFQAFIYVLLEVPYQVYLFFPIASLLGSLIGLGVLASNSELIVMRAAGVSILQITKAVLKAALILILIVTILGEFVIPVVNHYAENRKAFAMSKGQALRTARGIWVRDNNNFISIGRSEHGEKLKSVFQYQFNSQRQLLFVLYAARAIYENNAWTLFDVRQSRITPEKVVAETHKQLRWNLDLSPQVLAVAAIDPEEMSIVTLHNYVLARHSNRVEAGRYELSYWKRIFQPLASCVMMLLAIPFIFGPLRSSSMGLRLLAGISVGFSFYILNQFFGPISLVFRFPPMLAAAFPTILFSVIALMMMRRLR